MVGAFAICSQIGTAAAAQDADDSHITMVNGRERLQLHYLPDLVFPNFFGDPDTILRNPGLRVALSQISENGQSLDSIGSIDERRAVDLSMYEYDPVVQVMTIGGQGFCTGTVVTIEGYTPAKEGAIIVTAAHCLEVRDPQTGDVTYRFGPDDLRFEGEYLNENGERQTYVLYPDVLWQSPLYQENERIRIALREQFGPNFGYILQNDIALVFSHQTMPDDFFPALLLPVGAEQAQAISDAITEHQNGGAHITVTAAGHSADKPYLTTHEYARVVSATLNGIVSLADIVPGASGGPVFDTGANTPVALNSAGLPVMFAVNTTISAGMEYANHTYVANAVLNMVPFLRPEGAEDDESCIRVARVLASRLNMRIQPGVDARKLVRDTWEADDGLAQGTLVKVFDIARNADDEPWALVQTLLGRTGYVSANQDYLQIMPDICAP